jgi:serine/threonine protein kinase
MEYNYDIWSLGMALYELSNGGAHYYEGVTDEIVVVKGQKDLNRTLTNGGLDMRQKHQSFDYLLKDLIYRCLSVEPTDRPTIEEVQAHLFPNYECATCIAIKSLISVAY